MTLDRFSQPLPGENDDPDYDEQIAAERADDWRDRECDREAA